MIPKELSADTLSEMAGIARERDVELLLYPFTVWGLAGLPLRVDAWGAAGAAMGVSAPDDVPDKSVAAKGVEKTINMAQALNSRFLCGGYGHNNVATSRYNKQYPFSEQRKFITANLKEMARIIAGTGLIFAYENHCDFNGREIASIIEEVGSDSVRALYDFGNGAVALLRPDGGSAVSCSLCRSCPFQRFCRGGQSAAHKAVPRYAHGHDRMLSWRRLH